MTEQKPSHTVLMFSELYATEIALEALGDMPEKEADQLCEGALRIFSEWMESRGSVSEDKLSEKEDGGVKGIADTLPWECIDSNVKTPIGLFMSLFELGYEPLQAFLGTSDEKFDRASAILILLSATYLEDAAKASSEDYLPMAGELIERTLQISLMRLHSQAAHIEELKPKASHGANFRVKNLEAGKLRHDRKIQAVQGAIEKCKADGIAEPSAKEIFDRLDGAARELIPAEKAIYRLREKLQENKPQ
jgi:hypothetical protein